MPLNLVTKTNNEFFKNSSYFQIFCNQTNSAFSSSAHDKTEKLLSSIFLSIIILIGSFANPIMLTCLVRVWSANNSMFLHLLHLTIGDLIRVFFCLPTQLASYFELITVKRKPIILLQIRTFLDVFTEILQLLMLLLISHERYKAISKPFQKYQKKLTSILPVVSSWVLALLGGALASHFYEQYISITEMCFLNTHLYGFLVTFMLFESVTVIGILHFYTRTVYNLYKQSQKMQDLRQKSVHPFCVKTFPEKGKPQNDNMKSEKDKKDPGSPVRTKTMPLTSETPSNETKTGIKNNPELLKGLSPSANISSAFLVEERLSSNCDKKESEKKEEAIDKSQKAISQVFFNDSKSTEILNQEILVQEKTSKTLNASRNVDLVINCSLDSIASKTKIVDAQSSPITVREKNKPFFYEDDRTDRSKFTTVVDLEAGVSDLTASKTKSRKLSQNSSMDSQSPVESFVTDEKIFVISQQVKFTVKSISAHPVDIENVVDRSISFPTFKEQKLGFWSEQCLKQQAGDHKKETEKTDELKNPKTDKQSENETHEINVTCNEKKTTPEEKEKSILVPKAEIPSETTIGEIIQVTSEQETTIKASGPFCPMPKRSNTKLRRRKEQQITRRIAILILVLIIGWMPLYTIRILQMKFLQKKMCCDFKQLNFLWWGSLSASTSAINPCIYGILNIQLRNEFYQIIRRLKRKLCCRK